MKRFLLLFVLVGSAWAQTYISGPRVIEGGLNYCADAGGSDTYACSLSPALKAYQTGACYTFKANTANTGAASLNLNSLGALPLKTAAGADPSTDDIVAGGTYTVCYDGTNAVLSFAPRSAASKIYLEAAGCNGTTAFLSWNSLTAEEPPAACVTETSPTPDRTWAVGQFNDDQVYGLQRTVQLPSDWTGAVDLDYIWRTTETSGAVVWQSQTFCAGPAEATSGAWNAAAAAGADTADGTADDVNSVSDTGITMTGCAASDLLYLRVFRDPAHGSDNLATAVDGVADLIGVMVTLRRTQ